MPLREDDVAPRSGVPGRRTLLQGAGFALAILATLAVFLTDNPQVLRLAVVGVAWAFVLATFAAGRLSTERVAARARERELRRAYEYELDQEVAARREYELDLEAQLRREAEESMRAELDALRGELAGLADLRDEVARIADLGADLASLATLRDDVARVAALRDDVAGLSALRHELGQLGELRADVGRLRQELMEQLSSEMLIERIVMRTQASRLTGELQEAPGRALDAATRWRDDAPPRELTGGWPAVRLDEPRETRSAEPVERSAVRPPVPPPPVPPVSRPVPSPSWRPSWESEHEAPRSWEMPVTAAWESVSRPSWEAQTPSTAADDVEDTPLWSAAARAATAPQPESPPPTTTFSFGPRAVTQPPAPEPPSPLDWLAARSALDAEAPRRRRSDDAPAEPAAAPTAQRPAVPPNPPLRVDDRGSYRVAVRDERPAEPAGPSRHDKRLEDILAENGVQPPSGGRRRRRYRDDDEPDDVLARVLRSNS
ncbi:UNVERIFIED_ORG: hypothetical protein E4P37_13970 [Bacillus sp. AZ43]